MITNPDCTTVIHGGSLVILWAIRAGGPTWTRCYTGIHEGKPISTAAGDIADYVSQRKRHVGRTHTSRIASVDSDFPVPWQESPPFEHRQLQPPRPAKLSLGYNPNDPDDPMRHKIDNDVMKPQNHTQNSVTSRVARLAKGWTTERLRLLGGEIGPRRRQWDKTLYRRELEAAIEGAKAAPKARRLVNIDGTRLVPDLTSLVWKSV